MLLDERHDRELKLESVRAARERSGGVAHSPGVSRVGQG